MIKEEIEETRLSNGLTILTDRMNGVRSATLGFFYRVGSRNEPNELNGISHFIEHAVFKGTVRRTALDIATEQDRLGGNLDAFTTHEETGFAVKVVDEQLPAAFDLLADMLTRPKFDQPDLENEQRVIIEEIKMTEDSPDELLGEVFYRKFFPGHPLGLSIAGTSESVQSFDHKKTLAYHSDHFSAANLIVTAAGNVSHEYIVELAAKLELTDSRSVNDEKTASPKCAFPILIENKPDLEQAHLIVASQFVDGTDERRYAAELLANILGGGTSSRLWQKVREERGLAYSIGSSSVSFSDCGLLTVSAATSPEQVEEILDIVINEMRLIRTNGVTANELRLMKDQARASILLSLEDSADRAAALAHFELVHGRQISLEESLSNFESVSTEEIQAVADRFFINDGIAFSAIGPLGDLKIDRNRLRIS